MYRNACKVLYMADNKGTRANRILQACAPIRARGWVPEIAKCFSNGHPLLLYNDTPNKPPFLSINNPLYGSIYGCLVWFMGGKMVLNLLTSLFGGLALR